MNCPKCGSEAVSKALTQYPINHCLNCDNLFYVHNILVDNLQAEIAALKLRIEKLDEELKEICICAAIKTPSGIYRGHRHGDCFLVMQRKKILRSTEDIQGFITSRNRFVDRNEGRKLQDIARIESVSP